MKNWGRSVLAVTISSIIGLVLLGLVFSSALVQRTQADELYGRVRGIVTDSTGATLEGVNLKLHNVGTGATENALSDSSGSFNFINLKPGQYSLTATKDGFKTFDVSSIKVEPNEIYVQSVAMELGGISETIEVAANQAQVEQAPVVIVAWGAIEGWKEALGFASDSLR